MDVMQKSLDDEAAYERRMEQRMEYADELAEQRKSRRGCACGLDGYPGHCPGAENCPYADCEDDE
jgi:hypothetical protein